MPNDELVATCRAIAAENNCEIRLTSDVEEACTGANIIYTDIWVSMGEPASLWEERIRLLSPYQVNAKVMAMALIMRSSCIVCRHSTILTRRWRKTSRHVSVSLKWK